MKSRQLPALVAALTALAALLPAALTEWQHGDEAQYVWSAAYYGSKLARLDLAPGGSDPVTNPGWAPPSYWNVTQPMGARMVYALALGLSGAPTPEARARYSPEASGPDELLSLRTLIAVRLAAVACSALGFSLIALRLGWYGLLALLLLMLPQTRIDLSRAWAEGPLLLGLGLSVLAWGRRWFCAAAGVAATFKLTALGLWPLALLQAPYGRTPLRRLSALVASAGVWTLLMPPAWFGGGPAYLLIMLLDRQHEYARSAALAGGLFAPSRYLWPFELLVLVLSAAGLRYQSRSLQAWHSIPSSLLEALNHTSQRFSRALHRAVGL